MAEVSARLLEIVARSGIRWAVVWRNGAKVDEARAYAYGNTLVFPEWGDSHVFLVAMSEGTYADEQLKRYESGLWVTYPVDSPHDAELLVIDEIAGRLPV